MNQQERIAAARRRAVEQIDSAFTAVNDGKVDVAAGWYLGALEEIGRAKMFKENLGDAIADAPSNSIIKVDGVGMQARDARVQVALHFLRERSVHSPLQTPDASAYDAMKLSVSATELKQAIVGIKSLSVFL